VAYETPEYHPAFEEYCETVFELAEDDVPVIQARIAERLDVSRPAVSEMVQRLVRECLVEVSAAGSIKLTDQGTTLATQVVRRHRLAERFLTDILGLSWSESHHEAGKWEHVISPAVEKALARVLGNPTTCPHGNPIPGSDYVPPDDASLLCDLGAGQTFVIERIPEELEFRDGLLDYLEQAHLTPGNTGRVTAVAPDGTTTVEIAGASVGVGTFASARILVSAG